MQDLPPAELPIEPTVAVAPATESEAIVPAVSLEEREDGSVVIDLKTLVPKPEAEECLERDPNPLEPGIVVCGQTAADQRIDPQYGPTDDKEFGSAIPRAKVRLSDNAETEANVIKKGVGSFDADGAEVKIKIDFLSELAPIKFALRMEALNRLPIYQDDS